MSPPVFRFAPSPNGFLHLGHAYSALLNWTMARETGGRFLIRIEDIDPTRCKPEYEQAIYDELEWLGLEWETPVRRQSNHFDDYAVALGKLIKSGVLYRSFLSRTEAAKLSAQSRTDPLGAPLHPEIERNQDDMMEDPNHVPGAPAAWRLNMDKALALAGSELGWIECNTGNPVNIPADPAAWGDVIIARKETPTSYHLSVVVDDALQGITHVVRGMDLFAQTSVHRLLQALLGLPAPRYFHHRLITGEDGGKLSKSAASMPLRELRKHGVTATDVRRQLGF